MSVKKLVLSLTGVVSEWEGRKILLLSDGNGIQLIEEPKKAENDLMFHYLNEDDEVDVKITIEKRK